MIKTDVRWRQLLQQNKIYVNASDVLGILSFRLVNGFFACTLFICNFIDFILSYILMYIALLYTEMINKLSPYVYRKGFQQYDFQFCKNSLT